ncbi:MAG: hypothetical protein MJ153_03360 [Clostridia bacterium]|nr:hypothetical protein [Clostridia bacterium]
MYYHFENKKGWMNDPNGLVYFKGKYHAFFQHYPYATHWGQMHWGHAVSDDLIHWDEMNIALYPDQAYENDGGCFSGSAIVKDDRLYLFYTSVSHEFGQTQSLAYSDDGITFTKYEGNPIIKHSPLGDNKEFRDPKVIHYSGDNLYPYRMVVGAGIDGIGKILLFKSSDLFDWEYCGELLSDQDLGPCAECPDLFVVTNEKTNAVDDLSSPFYDIYKELGIEPPQPIINDGKSVENRWILMYSCIKARPYRVCFRTCDFDGVHLNNLSEPFALESGPDFYAPQTFEAPDKRRILIAWMYNWQRSPSCAATHIGAFTIPREMKLNSESKLTMRPISEIMKKIKSESVFVKYDRGRLEIGYKGIKVFDKAYKDEPTIEVLEDIGVVEVFINGGEEVVTSYVC